jgi:tetratricopeptide (TPR) repeat protein
MRRAVDRIARLLHAQRSHPRSSLPEADAPSRGPEPIRPGALSALIAELVRAPEPEDAWAKELSPGEVVAGRFEIRRELGRGGFGVVYEARDLQLSRSVAFKAIHAGAHAALREERLLREAESAARLSHPCLVTLHDVGRCALGPYLVLELLTGQTLAARLARGPLPVREALRVAVKVAEGLAHAHGQGVVHRDLTPGNVFLCADGQVKVLDFGLAHAFGQRRADGGTPGYMAPEQWRGAPEDERTDVFALGVILHRALSGRLPFPEGDGGQAATGPAPAPSLDVPELPALGALVGRLLEKDPVRRPRDGGAAHAALAALQQELERSAGHLAGGRSLAPPSPPAAAHPGPPAAAAGGAPGATVRRPSARRRRAGSLSLGALVVVGALALGWHALHPAPPSGPPVVVAVADFTNLTGEQELDGLSGMLITSLEQSQRLSVLTRVRMLDLLRQQGRAGVEVIDESLGREVARAAGVRALVLATIRRFDDLYAIELKVLDPQKSEYLFTLQEEGRGKAAVPGLIDRLSERARRRLRYESAAELSANQVKVADVTTGSFEAYQHYFRGDQYKEAIRYDAAIAEYRQALAIDPHFALARYRIAYLGEFTGMDDAERRAEMERALADVDRVPAKERLLFQAWKAHLDDRDEEAHAIYARAAAAYPQDKEVQFLAGDLYLHEGRYVEGLPYFERAAALDPYWVPSLMHLADSFTYLGDADRLAELARGWVARAPDASAYRALGQAEALLGHPDAAVDAARKAYALDPSTFSLARLAEALELAWRFDEEETVARAALSAATRPADRKMATWIVIDALARQGRRREALDLVEQMPGDLPDRELLQASVRLGLFLGDRDPGPAREQAARVRALAASQPARMHEQHTWVAVMLAWLGDEAGALAGVRELPAADPERQLAEALVAWRRDAGQGRAQLRALTRTLGPEHRGLAWAALLVDAEAAGRDREVIEAAEAFLRLPIDGLWSSWARPRALISAARAHERLGDRPSARAALDRVLGGWRKADADLPDVIEARALRRRLEEG